MKHAAARLIMAVAMLSLILAGAAVGHPIAVRATVPMSLQAENNYGLEFAPGVEFVLVAMDGETPPAHFQEIIDGAPTDLGAATWQLVSVGIYQALNVVTNPTAGLHTYRIQVDDQVDQFVDHAVNVAPVTTTPVIAGSASVQAHHSVDLAASLTSQNTGADATGTVEWRDAVTHAHIETDDLTNGQPHLIATPTSVGVKHFEAVYSGDALHAPGTSATFDLTVTADTVQATGVGVDLTTFYPKVDGYRDLVHARGTRQERVSVSIRIYNSTNHIVRSLSVAAGTGAYSVGWNGKTTSGVLAPAGSYRIVQVLTDTAATHRTVSSTVALSWKKIYLYSTTLTRTAPTQKTVSWAAWQFTLPSATIYKSLNFQIYGKSTVYPGIYIGGQDVRLCPFSTYSPGCVLSSTNVSYSLGWHGRSLSPTYNRSGRYVRGYAEAGYGGGGVFYPKARLLVTYGILR